MGVRKGVTTFSVCGAHAHYLRVVIAPPSPGKYSIYPFLFPLPFLVACTGEFNLADCTEACEVNQGQMTGTGTHMRSSFPCRDEDGRGTIQDTRKYKKPRGLFSCVIISLRSSRT